MEVYSSASTGNKITIPITATNGDEIFILAQGQATPPNSTTDTDIKLLVNGNTLQTFTTDNSVNLIGYSIMGTFSATSSTNNVVLDGGNPGNLDYSLSRTKLLVIRDYADIATGTPQVSLSLNDLTDVTITDPVNGDVLSYGGGLWFNLDEGTTTIQNFISMGSSSTSTIDVNVTSTTTLPEIISVDNFGFNIFGALIVFAIVFWFFMSLFKVNKK